MSSLVSPRDVNTPARSGGKIFRQRSRTTLSSSPYDRPREISQEAAQLRSPRWLSVFFSGAGKIISSVLPSRASDPDKYSSSDEEGSESSGCDEDEEDHSGFDQVGKKPENICTKASSATVPKSDTKRVIEQMVMKETFLRDECDRLIKLIQSRVIGSSSWDICGNGARDLCRTTIQHESSSRFGLKQSFTERFPHLSEPFVSEACTHNQHSKAMLEAKMWLDEKKSASKPKNDPKTCTLNNDFGFDSREISPVDIAKSYMKALPPWRSPSYSGFKTPPSGLNLLKGRSHEIYNTTTDIALPSSEGRTRDHLGFATLDTSNEIRRVRSRTIYDQLDISKSKSSEKSTEAPKHVNNNSVNADREDCNGDASHQAIETNNLNSSNNLAEPITVHETVEISLSDSHPLEVTQHSEEFPFKEGGEKISVSHGTVTSVSRSVEHDRNTSFEREVTVEENKESAMLSKSSDGGEKLNEVGPLSQQASSGVHVVNGVEKCRGDEDPRPRDKAHDTLNETNGSIKASVKSLLVENGANEEAETYKLVSQINTKMTPLVEMLPPMEAKETKIRPGKKRVAKSRRSGRVKNVYANVM